MELKKTWKVKKVYRREAVLVGVVAVLLSSFLYIGGGNVAKYTVQEEQQMVEEAIRRAVVQCYAIEGMYPPDVNYIKEVYGVGVDDKKYIVHYDIFASNIMPDIQVIRKTWEDE